MDGWRNTARIAGVLAVAAGGVLAASPGGAAARTGTAGSDAYAQAWVAEMSAVQYENGGTLPPQAVSQYPGGPRRARGVQDMIATDPVTNRLPVDDGEILTMRSSAHADPAGGTSEASSTIVGITVEPTEGWAGLSKLAAASFGARCEAGPEGVRGEVFGLNGTMQAYAASGAPIQVAIPHTVPPNYTLTSQSPTDLPAGPAIITYVLNQQIKNPDGSITVNAVVRSASYPVTPETLGWDIETLGHVTCAPGMPTETDGDGAPGVGR